MPRTPCLVYLAREILPGPMGPGPWPQARSPRQDLPGKCPRQGVLGQICPALAKNMQHWRKLFKLLCFLTCVLQKVLKTKQNGSDHHQVPRLHTKSTRGDTEVKTGTGRHPVEPGKETSLEPLKHTLFGEKTPPPLRTNKEFV